MARDYYAEALEAGKQYEQDKAATIRNNLYSTSGTNPDAEAQVQALSKSMNIPIESARQEMESLRAKAAANKVDVNALLKNLPNTAQFLTKQENVAVSHDDIDNLSLFETLTNSFKRGVPGLQQNFSTTGLRSNARYLESIKQVEAQLAAGKKPEQFKMDEDPIGVAYLSQERRNQMKEQAERLIRRQAKDVSDLEFEKAQIPQPAVVSKVMEAGKKEGFRGALREFYKEPGKFIASIGPESMVANAPALITAIPATMAGGPVAGGAVMGFGSYATDYESSFREGLAENGINIRDPKQLEAAMKDPRLVKKVGEAAASHALIVGAFDAASGGIAGKTLLPARLLAKSPIAREVANIGLQIPVQGTLGAAGEAGGELFAGQKLDPGNILAEFVGEAFSAPTDVVSLGYSQMRERMRAAKEGEQTKQFISDLSNAAEQSKTLARAPEVFQQFLESTTDGTPAQDVYISANALMQSGVADQVAAVLPSVREQLTDASASNGYVRIPTAEYITAMAGNELNQSLIDNIKLDPNGYTFAESQEYQKTFNQEMTTKLEQMMSEKQGDDAFKASRDAVREKYLADLNTANRFTTEANQAYASMLASFYAVQAARANMTTEEFVKKYNLEVVNRAVESQNLFDQQGNPTPEFKQWFAESKVVDAAGKPLKVYHGARPEVDITQFKARNTTDGIYFTPDASYAEGFTNDLSGDNPDANGATYPVYLSIKNPYEVTAAPGSDEWDSFVDRGLNREELKQQGYDGAILRDSETGEIDQIMAFEPEQIKSVFNERPTNDPNILNQSAKPVPTSVDAVSTARASFDFAATKTFATNRDFKLELQARVLKAAKEARVDLSEQSERVVEYLVRVGLADAMSGLENNANAVGWYNEKVNKALRIVSLIHPEINTDPQAKFAFVWALAVTSNGMKVDKNFELAEGAYETYKTTGKMPTNLDAGQAQEAINDSLGLFNDLMDQWGFEKLEKFMTTMDEVRNIEAESDIEITGEGKGTQVFGAAILGPKIGNGFFANLYGYFDQLTMDRWLMRTWGRWTGTLINVKKDAVNLKQEQLKGLIELMDPDSKKEFERIINAKLSTTRLNDTALAIATASQDPKIRAQMNEVLPLDMLLFPEAINDLLGPAKKNQLRTTLGAELRKMGNGLTKALDGQKEAPAGAKERTFIRSVFREVLNKLQEQYPQLTMSDLQAVVWYPEKKLYDTAKSAEQESDEAYNDDEAPDYANAAAKLARKKGIEQAAIDQAQKEVDDEIKVQADAAKRQADERAAGARRADAGEEGSRGVPGQAQGATGTGSQGQAGTLNQSGELDQPARGQISFADDITRQPSVIALLKDADLSTFVHESGHFFLQVQADLASRIEARIAAGEQVSQGEREIVSDMNTVLDWFGIPGTPEVSAINTWSSMSLEEQRPYHEKWARGFEAYAFEGKAPTMELQPIFQKFGAWLKRIYSDMKALNVELTDEVRGVMDRMLATTEQIQAAEAARAMGPLFSAQNAQGVIEDWKAYHDLGLAATQEGIDILQARGLTDMKWLGNAKSRKLKELQKSVKALRTEAMMDARREVMSQPIYRAWQFLTSKIEKDDKLAPDTPRKSDPDVVDPQIDSLFTAIAKLGGISKAQVVAKWGWDPKERSPVPVFGKPTVRTEGGLSIDAMGQLLEQYGYLELDEQGRYDPAQFEELFDNEARGNAQYSNQVDPSIFVDPLPGASVVLSNMKAGRFDLFSLNSLGLDDSIVERIKDLKMTAKDGIHPDIIAAEFEFTSGVELVQKIAASPKPQEAIEALTDQIMMQRHGDLATPEGVQRAADQAVHNEARLKFLHTEAKALETAMRVRADTGKTNAKGQKQTYAVLPQAAREFAAGIIAKLRVRDLRPTQYTAAEVKAAKEAERAFLKGDLETAAEQKRNQIINAYTAKEAMAAAAEVQQAVAYFRKFDKRSKGLDPDYYDQIVQMLERFEFVPSTSLKEVDARVSLANWLEAQREQGIEPDIPPKLVLEAYRTSYKNMTIEDIRGLRDTVKQIEHLGRLKMKLLNAADARAFAEIRQQMVDSINENAGNRFVSNRQPATLLGEKWLSIKNYAAEHIKAATFGYVLDGGKNGGPIWEYLIRASNHAGNKETVMRADATRDLTRLIAPVLKQGKLTQKIFIEGLANAEDREQGRTGSTWTREQLLTMALNMGNASNMQRLLDGEGWTLEQLKLGLDQLTSDDWQFAQQVWDYFESYRPEIAAKERRIYGKEPNWIEPQALTVQTADGQTLTLRGGYYPVKYDTRASLRAEQDMSAEEAKRAMQSSYIASTTRRSFTKERAAVVKERPLLYTLDGIYQGVNEVIHDLAWHEWVIDANKILKDPEISSVIRKHYGDYMHKQLTKWVDDNANGDQGAKGAGEKAAAFVRQSVSVAGLGINIISALTQPFGITQSMVRIGPKYVGRGVARMAQNPMQLNRDINQMSDFMRTRSQTRMRELAELRNRVKNKSKTKENIDATMYLMMLGAQRLVDLPTWWGAYERATAEGNDQERAIDLADQAVIDSQGSGMTKDLAAIERGGPVQKLFTVFYSFMNTALNLGYAKAMTQSSKAKLAMDYLLLYVVPVVLVAAMKDALTPGDSGDWDDLESIMNKLVKEELSFLSGMFVGIREFGPIYDAFRGHGEYKGPAGLRPIGDAFKLAKEIGQGEMDDGLRKASINMAGDIFGLPAAQINRTITGAEALNDGKTDNPGALLFGHQDRR